MNLVDVLSGSKETVLAEALRALERARLPHYEEAGTEVSRRRLEELFALVTRCLGERNLTPICQHSETVAAERYAAGFGIAEVQAAFNVLEESIWRVVVPQVPPKALIEATGLVGTVLGAGKDALARKWVSMASAQHVPTLDLSALFAGTHS